jgi:hypothetical protein
MGARRPNRRAGWRCFGAEHLEGIEERNWRIGGGEKTAIADGQAKVTKPTRNPYLLL